MAHFVSSSVSVTVKMSPNIKIHCGIDKPPSDILVKIGLQNNRLGNLTPEGYQQIAHTCTQNQRHLQNAPLLKYTAQYAISRQSIVMNIPFHSFVF